MRKIIASRMIESKSVSAHVTSFVEADVSTIVSWRNKFKEQFKTSSGQSLNFTPIIIESIVKAIKDHPMINIQVQGDKIIKKSNINIGVAVALPSGNLIVPVIKNSEMLDLKSFVMTVNDLAHRARTNALNPDELEVNDNLNQIRQSFRQIEIKSADDRLEEARKLNQFQKKALNVAIEFAMDVVISRKGMIQTVHT